MTVDEIRRPFRPLFKRLGPAVQYSDSELMTMTLVGKCRGWDQETDLPQKCRENCGVLRISSQSRFNRRRRQLMQVLNLIRQVVLRTLDVTQEQPCVSDTLPIPVVQFHLVWSSTGQGAVYGETFGQVQSKQQTIYGYKLHLLITVEGLILDFELAPPTRVTWTC